MNRSSVAPITIAGFTDTDPAAVKPGSVMVMVVVVPVVLMCRIKSSTGATVSDASGTAIAEMVPLELGALIAFVAGSAIRFSSDLGAVGEDERGENGSASRVLNRPGLPGRNGAAHHQPGEGPTRIHVGHQGILHRREQNIDPAVSAKHVAFVAG